MAADNFDAALPVLIGGTNASPGVQKVEHSAPNQLWAW